MNRRDAIRRSACASTAVALPARCEPACDVPGLFDDLDFGARAPVASNLVGLSMLTGDREVRR